jgi:hypothetical protein
LPPINSVILCDISSGKNIPIYESVMTANAILWIWR